LFNYQTAAYPRILIVAAGLQNRGSLTVLRNEVLMTVLIQLVSGIAITFVCVLLVVAGCGNGTSEWRGIDSGYDSRAGQSWDAKQQANVSN